MSGAGSKVITTNITNTPVINGNPHRGTNHDANNQQDKPYEMEIVWKNAAIFVVLHGMAIYGLYLHVTTAKILTSVFYWFYTSFTAMGITGGAHRLWAHRAYKARLPMRILLMLMQSAVHQNSIYEWSRDHRAHHKYTDTNADPHNSTRGFFFSHMGWLIVKKHPDVRRLGAGVDMSDVINDPVVAFQKKYFYILMPIMCFTLPTVIPMYFWGESFKTSFFTTVLRYTMSLHFTWLVNSAAHLWGNKPYNKFLTSSENLGVSIAAYGEGWHNYHHVFPWDYKAAELGNYKGNLTTGFIDFFAKLGLAYDLKTVPMEMVRKRCEKTGDGSWSNGGKNHSHGNDVWGWDDMDMTKEDRTETQILRRID